MKQKRGLEYCLAEKPGLGQQYGPFRLENLTKFSPSLPVVGYVDSSTAGVSKGGWGRHNNIGGLSPHFGKFFVFNRNPGQFLTTCKPAS
jgi:hypothetical protein